MSDDPLADLSYKDLVMVEYVADRYEIGREAAFQLVMSRSDGAGVRLEVDG